MALRTARPRAYAAAVVTVALLLLCKWWNPSYLLSAAPLVSIVLLVFGLPEAASLRDASSFRTGIILLAIGLSFWMLPLYWVSRQTAEIRAQLDLVAFLVAVIVSGLLVVVGLQVIGMAITEEVKGRSS